MRDPVTTMLLAGAAAPEASAGAGVPSGSVSRWPVAAWPSAGTATTMLPRQPAKSTARTEFLPFCVLTMSPLGLFFLGCGTSGEGAATPPHADPWSATQAAKG